MSAWYPPTMYFSGSRILLRYWTPELPPCILYFSRSTKSAGLPPCQTRNVFDLIRVSGVVLPVIAPSWTDQWIESPSQPERSLPLNRLTKPSSSAADAEDVGAIDQSAPHARLASRTIARRRLMIGLHD